MMKRYVIPILLALMIMSCVSSPTSAPTLVSNQLATEESAHATRAVAATLVNAATASPLDINSSTPVTMLPPAVATTQEIFSSSTRMTGTLPSPEFTTRSQDGMIMLYVPAGDFTMGNWFGAGSDEESPQHLVTLDGYWIDRTEVTNAQYHAFVNATSYRAPVFCELVDLTFDETTKADHPVVCVNWDDAQNYCEWVGGRLPTEAEWEKAARGLDMRTYPWGDPFDGKLVNYCDTNCELNHKDAGTDDGYARTAPVGSYPAGASPYGALDMAGNVWEWVSDWYNFYYYAKSPQLNPLGPNSGKYRVLRGGAWSGFPTNARTTFRAWLAPDEGDKAIGFRCVVTSVPIQR